MQRKVGASTFILSRKPINSYKPTDLELGRLFTHRQHVRRRNGSVDLYDGKYYNYYLVKGSNAVAVVQSWSHANRIWKYVKGFNCKGYDTYDEANEDGLEHLAEITPYYIPLPDFLTLGKVVSVSSQNEAYLKGEKENKQ